MKDHKVAFLKEEFLLMAFSGAFQRANVYGGNAPEKRKKEFRGHLGEIVVRMETEAYSGRSVNDEMHCDNIQRICTIASRKFGDILSDGKFRVGVAQKLLNLYLKYLWCAELISEPPHCPIDRGIILLCDRHSKISWTKIESIQEYMSIITKARDAAKASNMSLAKWELIHFRRKD